MLPNRNDFIDPAVEQRSCCRVSTSAYVAVYLGVGKYLAGSPEATQQLFALVGKLRQPVQLDCM